MTVRFIGGPYDGIVRAVDYDSPVIRIPVEVPGTLGGNIEYSLDCLHCQGIRYMNSPRHYLFVKWEPRESDSQT